MGQVRGRGNRACGLQKAAAVYIGPHALASRFRKRFLQFGVAGCGLSTVSKSFVSDSEPYQAASAAIMSSISRISSGCKRNSEAPTIPETCFGLRNPTIAPVTAG